MIVNAWTRATLSPPTISGSQRSNLGMRPDERVELAHTPQRLVGETDLASHGVPSAGLAQAHNSDSTAYAAPRSKLESRAEGGVATVRPVEYAVNSSCARDWGSKKLAYLAVASSPTGTRPGAAARSAKISAAATSASSALP